MYEQVNLFIQLVSYLWEGSINGEDEALQLILILDYVLNWARDIFRPSIWRQLKMLSTSNLDETLTFRDSAILSHGSTSRYSDIPRHQPDTTPWIPSRSM